MRLFGSVARNEHREGSDVDIYVTMPPKFFNYIQAAQYLEELLGCSVGGEYDGDYDALLDAAHKAVEHGNTVYLLPNPRNCRTADFIFKKKGAYMMYDLKTVYGKGSVGTQLLDSIGQSNRILLNITSDYNGRLLAADIKAYFEANRNAVEVLLFKGKKTISVNRYSAQSPMFYRQFRKIYEQ